MKPLLSVVVPVHNVEDYLAECLESLARQSLDALEVVMVDDGSTDGSRRIAEEFAARDDRFRCVHQPNAGLSAARNTGIARTTPGVPYLAFADSDDVLVLDAYERMLASLESTGSDLVTGNVWRLDEQGRRQAWQYRWLTGDRLRTHITRDARLLADRVAWNKVFRRSFWDRHAFSFPVGKLYEDTPVMIPAHYLAKSVDVLHEHVYHWRVREGSITRRRTDVRGVRDRIAACEQVSAFLSDRGAGQRLRYDASCLRDDFVYFLEGLPMGGPAYRSAFMADAGAFLDRAGDAALAGLPAEARIRWQLVRERRVHELLAVLEFERANGTGTFAVAGPPGRRRAVHPRVADGRSVSARLGKGDLPVVARLVESSWADDGTLRLRGYAYVRNLPAESARQSLKGGLVREAGGGRMRPVPVRTVRTDRATADSGQELHRYDHAGFEMVLDPGRLGPGSWLVGVVVAGHGVVRRAALRAVEAAAAQPLVRDLGGGLRAVLGYRDGRLELTVTRLSAMATGHDRGPDTLELTGRLYGGAGPTALVLSRDGSEERVCPVRCGEGGEGFGVRLPLAALAAGSGPGREGRWRAALLADGVRVPLAAAPDLPAPAFADAGGHLVVDLSGEPCVDRAGAAPGGGLRIDGTGAGVLELRHSTLGGRVTVPVSRQKSVERHEPAGRREQRFAAVLARPPREGDWEVFLGGRPVRVEAALAARLPLGAAGSGFRLDRRHGDRLTVRCAPPLGDAERSAYHQSRLRTGHHPAQRRLPLRDAVLHTGDGPVRAVHTELVRRSTDAEHLWVTDGSEGTASGVPSTAVPVVTHSAAWYEALARSRWIVAAGHLPAWFERRPGQTVVQTWHGSPLGRFGLDLSGSLYADHQDLATLAHRSAQWSVLVSPGAFATPHLRRALAYRGEVLEAGSPADDLLFAPGRDKTAERVRRQLGVPDGHRVVLYAPTYRDHLAHPPEDVPLGSAPLYRWDPALDLAALTRSLDRRTTVLVRRHPRVTGSVPVHPALRDVSAHPDATELLLIADVLLTDYSGLVFGFAHTGRPVLFHTYDLEHYRDTVRGFCLDFETRAPGPLLVTTQEVAQALRTTPASAALHAEAYESFRRDHCGPAGGGAARRVVDRLLCGDPGPGERVRP
ncbi:CDP-glycerol glycerophosphotransferase family protein [Streptomyces sp. JH34]|uniref:CDP-glycerol glycerophosphotransferase family protein n=1 Tax=Streptomyces sp. JH34 TaxID=2793633 RepID=UPI0023F98C7E|nr:CDP-glycerol glycerophosphotransferase family protein [Streptomyces sp. JH34]MDF6020686.1 CDP-glycerol glycerophosphotransferase family protein [Streptomyces sp. JH34]